MRFGTGNLERLFRMAAMRAERARGAVGRQADDAIWSGKYLTTRATDASRGRAVKIQTLDWDRLIANQTKAEVPVIQPLQRRLDLPLIHYSASLGLLGHRLVPQGIHAGQPADPALVKLDGPGLLVRGADQGLQFITPRHKQRAKMVEIKAEVVCHARTMTDRAGASNKRCDLS